MQLRDKDPVGADFLGQAQLALSEPQWRLGSQREIEHTLFLRNKNGIQQAGIGTLTLRLQWHYNANAEHDVSATLRGRQVMMDLIQTEEFDKAADKRLTAQGDAEDEEFDLRADRAEEEDSKAEQEALEQALMEVRDFETKDGDYEIIVHGLSPAVSPSLVSTSLAQTLTQNPNPNPHLHPNPDPNPGPHPDPNPTVDEARGLTAKDLSNTSDPFVVVEVMGQRQSTRVNRSCVNCVWDQTLIFQFKVWLRSQHTPEKLTAFQNCFAQGLTREQVEAARIDFRVLDSDTGSFNSPVNELIGSYSVDATFAYQQKSHELYRQWVTLTVPLAESLRALKKQRKAKKHRKDVHTGGSDPLDGTGVTGYLSMSCTVLGPGDKMPHHNHDAEMAAERKAEEDTGPAKMEVRKQDCRMQMVLVLTSIKLGFSRS